MTIGVEDAVDLSDGQQWLVDRISVRAMQRSRGVISTVVGACGGAGASTLAAAMVLAGDGADESALLIDADPRGGCFDLLLGEDQPGLGWSDLGSLSGRVSGDSLYEAVAVLGGVPVITHRRDEGIQPVPDDAFHAALTASAATFAHTVVDLGAGSDLGRALTVSDVVVVATTSDPRGVVALRRTVDLLDAFPGPIVVAFRTPHRRCLPTDLVIEAADGSADVLWISEIRGHARRFARSMAGVTRRDAIVDDAFSVLGACSRLAAAP